MCALIEGLGRVGRDDIKLELLLLCSASFHQEIKAEMAFAVPRVEITTCGPGRWSQSQLLL